ncbi:hypothetical protein BK004_04840 [bacterium CG10_46_32]|nr:MAG: hypothetical protein BK004_04840 [bacterium CG10_46_32]PIR55698.1 MAG: hypothetical protein COU73_04880 [Parcubacteria group bacterium CG10_big_fil_rev_8_21_14_0_10_46_32]
MKIKIGIGIVILLIAGAIGYVMFLKGPYPSKISEFPLSSINDENALTYSECFLFGSNETCVSGIGSVTYGNNKERNDVVRLEVTSGIDSHKSYLKSLCNEPKYSCEKNIIVDGKTYETQKMMHWYYENNKFVEIKQWGDNIKILESPVVKYFMKKYPPIQI